MLAALLAQGWTGLDCLQVSSHLDADVPERRPVRLMSTSPRPPPGGTPHAAPPAAPSAAFPFGVEATALKASHRSLLIGVGYRGTDYARPGCERHVDLVRQWLVSQGFHGPQQVLLEAPQSPPEDLPTRANICAALQWLVQGVQTGDSLLVYFYGHTTEA